MDVPFYKNPDATHCYQAVFRMILKYYLPEKDFTWKELEEITAKKGDLWTWPTAGMLWLYNQGFEVYNVETFSYSEFSKKGGRYLIERSGEGIAHTQITHSDIPQEIGYAKQIVHTNICDVRAPSLDELKNRLDQGHVLICNVNSCLLNDRKGFVGHFVLVIGYDGKHLILNDPGPPGIEKRAVPFNIFEKAWEYPNKNARNYISVKL